MEWDGRVVLITGGSRGIGLATADRFLSAGASVVVTGRGEASLAGAVARLEDAQQVRGQVRGQVHGAGADVSSGAGCRAAVAAATAAFGRLDLLFTNAGGYESAPLAEMTEKLWDDTIDCHLKGTFFTVQAAAPALRETGGCVVTMASDAGLLGMRGGWAAYCAAMGGVVNLTRQLALDLAPRVRVNAVAPGPVSTEKLHADLAADSYGGFQGGGFEGGGDAVAALTGTLPIGRLVEPGEIARAVYFLAGMSSMTGTVLSVDGGTSIALP